MSAPKIRLTAVIMDVLDVLTNSPPDDPAWGLRLCEVTGYGTGTIYPALDRLMKAGWITDHWEDPPPEDRPSPPVLRDDLDRARAVRCRAASAARTPRGMASTRPARRRRRVTRSGRESPLLLLGGIVLTGGWCVASMAADWAVTSIVLKWMSRRMPSLIYDIGRWWGIGRWVVALGLVFSVSAFLFECYTDPLTGFSARSLTNLAALLAGRRRSELHDEWHAHLASESDHDPVARAKVRHRQALGFVAAAVQLRLADAADLAWRPVDAVLGSRTLSNLFVWGPVIVTLFAIVHHDGRFGLVADDQDPAALGAFLYVVIKTGRWWRGVKPPEPKARRARE